MFQKYKPVLFGVEGPVLSAAEEEFFRQAKPLGFILMGRNIQNKNQVRELVKSLKKAVDNNDSPIMIDQEGGRVARLKEPIWYHPPAASIFGRIAKKNMEDAKRAVEINSMLIAHDLIELGIKMDATPVLDIPVPNSHSVIGDRAFSTSKTIVTELGRVVCDTLSRHGVVPVMKHIPGHGRAKADSHLELPVVKASISALNRTDFFPFKELSDNTNWAMIAHVLYTSLDKGNCATFSKKVVTIIKQDIGFGGLLITDCITMKALSGTIEKRAQRAVEAGCDIVLHTRHTNGTIADMQSVIDAVPFIDDRQAALLETSLLNSQSAAENLEGDRFSMFSELRDILGRYSHAGVMDSAHTDPTER
jgi:beta-N-acetylhexosaminidase